MNVIKAIVYSNLWIALGASAYACHSYLATDKKINYAFVLLAFFATFFAYNFERLIRINQLKFELSERQEWIKRHQKMMQILTLVAFLVSCSISVFSFTMYDALMLVPALIVVLFYTTFFVKQNIGLKDIPTLKIVLIASVWAYVLGVFPLVDVCPQKELIYLFTDKFSFILAITIPFDIRDIYKDSDSKKTIPQLFGITASKLIAIAFLAVSSFIHYNYFEVNKLTLIGYFLLVGLLIFFANPNRKELYFSGLLDGVLVASVLVFL